MTPSEPAEPLDRRIGELIRLRRITLGLTQEQLAQSLGLSYQQIQKYENGSNRVAAARLAQLAKRLAVPVAFFLEPAPPAAPNEAGAQGRPERNAIEPLRDLGAIEDAELRRAITNLLRAVAERQA